MTTFINKVECTCQIVNIIWTDGWSILDYNILGDVVSLDNTFNTNKYGLPLPPSFGMNCHD